MAAAALPATALAETAEPVEGLAPVASVPDASTAPDTGPLATPGATTGPTPAAATAPAEPVLTGDEARREDLDGSLGKLRGLSARLAEERTGLQARLLRAAAERETAENRYDTATSRLAARLVELLEQDDAARLAALIALRDEADPELRAELVAALHAADRPLVAAQDAALAAATELGAAADALRARVLAINTRIVAIDAAIEARSAPTAAERARARKRRFSVDSDMIFATEPIPGIGYWGDATGGGMLTGWTGVMGAAIGGVGCEAPDPALRASGAIEQGESSWYGPGFHGQSTANGETYDQEALTAAHPTLPFGTIVRVYSSVNARCVFVRINDRGPFVDGRIIDLSHAAAQAIELSGVAPVQVEVWS